MPVDRKRGKDADHGHRRGQAPRASLGRVIEHSASAERLSKRDHGNVERTEAPERRLKALPKAGERRRRRVVDTDAVARVDHDVPLRVQVRDPGRKPLPWKHRAPTVSEDDDAPNMPARAKYPHLRGA